MSEDSIGVLEQERRRQQEWADLGQPDPIAVLAAERVVERLYDLPTWHHPDRASLDAYFGANPDVQPPSLGSRLRSTRPTVTASSKRAGLSLTERSDGRGRACSGERPGFR